MQIKELQITKQLKKSNQSGQDLATLLREKGWKLLGYGFEAGVAAHPHKSYVLKIFPQNSPYVHFVNMVKENPHNPHFPRFSRYVRQIPGTEFSYVRMEKLSKMDDYDLFNTPSLLCLLDKLYSSYNELSPHWVRNNVSYDPDSGLIDCNQTKINPDEREAIQLLDQALIQVGIHSLDLHAGNFMLRGNTWVITDPFI